MVYLSSLILQESYGDYRRTQQEVPVRIAEWKSRALQISRKFQVYCLTIYSSLGNPKKTGVKITRSKLSFSYVLFSFFIFFLIYVPLFYF